MLVLTRKTDESIVIDDRITVKVIAVRGKRVKLGIDAPANVGIQRLETRSPVEVEFELASQEESLLSAASQP